MASFRPAIGKISLDLALDLLRPAGKSPVRGPSAEIQTVETPVATLRPSSATGDLIGPRHIVIPPHQLALMVKQ